jgi:hypothetical protein
MFKVLQSITGSALLEDGSSITIRASIGAVNEVTNTPAGVFVGLRTSSQISATSPPELRKAVQEKPIIRPGDSQALEKWKILKIRDFTSASETIVYHGTDSRTYHITFEVIPNIASRTLEFRDEFGNPAYYIRWDERVSTKLVEE